MKVIINGFVDNMPEWMTAADTIVTKAGPGTIAESLICNLPVLLNDFVPCQEHGNVPWVIDNGVRSCLCVTGKALLLSSQVLTGYALFLAQSRSS